MKLYYAPGTIAVAVAITLDEAGLDYTPHRLDFRAGEQHGAAYLKVNPKGRVPALATDRGVLTETGAILDHIAALAPQAGLVPDDAFDAARMREAMYYLAATMHVNHAHRPRGDRWAERPESLADMAAKVPQTMSESCRYVEDHVLVAPFVLGTAFSLADPYLFVISTWLEADGVDVARFPKLGAFRDAMRTRASVQHAASLGMI